MKQKSFKSAVNDFAKTIKSLETFNQSVKENFPAAIPSKEVPVKPAAKQAAKSIRAGVVKKPVVNETAIGIDPHAKKKSKAKVTITKKVAEYKHRPVTVQEIQAALVEGLQKQKPEFLLTGFRYQANIMQLAMINKQRLSEFSIITTQEELDKEFKMLYRMGKIIVNKHSRLMDGKALPNYFWFVVPAGSKELIKNLPEHCGVLTFSNETGIKQHRPAPVLHKHGILPSTYQNIAKHIEAAKSPQNAK